MNKKLIALLTAALGIASIVVLFRSSIGAEWLWSASDSGQWLLPLVAVSALIDAINPCAFAVLLLTIAFLFSIGKLRDKVLKIGGVYIAGIFLAYILVGLGLFQAFHLFNAPGFMGKLGAALMILLGIISILNDRLPNFPLKLKIPSVSHSRIASLMERATVPTAFVLGLLVGICEFPCTGGPYLMVIGLLHDEATYFTGIAYLVLYNLLFVLPLVIVLLITGDKSVVGKVQRWRGNNLGHARLWGGIAMIVIGILIWMI
jgi:cytochrome c-type biogenesis protein